MPESKRERILRLIRKSRDRTVDRGCTPTEAAGFAAKVAQWIEEYQIEESEIQETEGRTESPMEFCQDFISTHKKVHNPGVTQVVNQMAEAVCCKCILRHVNGNAFYGIVGESLDVEYVLQMAPIVVSQLQTMATLEGREHGYEKAGLIRWSNQYLTGAAIVIRKRIEDERRARSREREKCEVQRRLTDAGSHEQVDNLPNSVLEQLLNALRDGTIDKIVAGNVHNVKDEPGTALMVVTGESLAVAKREGTAKEFARLYPKTREQKTRMEYDHTAHVRGQEAGKRVGLNRQIDK